MKKIAFMNLLLKTKMFVKNYYLIILSVVLLVLVPLIIVISDQYFWTADKNKHASAAQPSITPTIPEPLVFRDSKTNSALSIQLTDGLPTTGQFYFFVPQIGYYKSMIPLLRSGPQIVHPQGQVITQFSPLQEGKPTDVAMKMEGEINIKSNTASINIWIGNIKYHLQTATVDITQATAVAKKSVTYTTSHDWKGVYNLFSPDIQATTSQAQFMQIMSDTSQPTVISAQLNGTGQIKTIGGYSYFAQPISVTMKQQDGSTKTYHSSEYFVLINDTWELLTTDTPTSP